VSSGMLCRVALVRTDVSAEPSASYIPVTRIGELGTTQAATSNRRTLCYSKFNDSCHPDEEELGSSKSRFLQEPHGVTSQKTSFFIVTAVKTSDLALLLLVSTATATGDKFKPTTLRLIRRQGDNTEL
jgi:hypothetical protein